MTFRDARTLTRATETEMSGNSGGAKPWERAADAIEAIAYPPGTIVSKAELRLLLGIGEIGNDLSRDKAYRIAYLGLREELRERKIPTETVSGEGIRILAHDDVPAQAASETRDRLNAALVHGYRVLSAADSAKQSSAARVRQADAETKLDSLRSILRKAVRGWR